MSRRGRDIAGPHQRLADEKTACAGPREPIEIGRLRYAALADDYMALRHQGCKLLRCLKIYLQRLEITIIDTNKRSVEGKGAIYAYTIMYHVGDKRFSSAVPYASIIVELDDAPGALLAANLLEAPYTDAKVGRRVEVMFEPLNDDFTLPQFRLARDAK